VVKAVKNQLDFSPISPTPLVPGGQAVKAVIFYLDYFRPPQNTREPD
jgi:hypothetical protein